MFQHLLTQTRVNSPERLLVDSSSESGVLEEKGPQTIKIVETPVKEEL